MPEQDEPRKVTIISPVDSKKCCVCKSLRVSEEFKKHPSVTSAIDVTRILNETKTLIMNIGNGEGTSKYLEKACIKHTEEEVIVLDWGTCKRNVAEGERNIKNKGYKQHGF